MIGHIISHLRTLSIDPTDPRVVFSGLPKLKFDRGKNDHVIQDGYCNVCQTIV